MHSRRFPFWLLACFAACTGASPPGAAPPPDAEEGAGRAVVYLVRHAETEDGGAERRLSGAGRARAEALATRLATAGVERILTTDYPRTRETAAPLGDRLALVPQLYDPDALAELADTLRRTGGTTLVVGHSNTTPELVELLGGDPGSPIAEDEHDRLYRVELPSGATTLERLPASAPR